MIYNIPNYQLETELTLHDSSRSRLTVQKLAFNLTKRNESISTCCLIFEVPPEVYYHIDTNALFNLKPELRGAFNNREFDPNSNIEITASLKPLDFDDGEIRYKTSIDVEGASLNFFTCLIN